MAKRIEENKEGYLHFPIHVLMDDSLRLFESYCDGFELQHHLNNGLKRQFILESSDECISDNIAEINRHFDEENNPHYQIRIWDNFCQFLWCVCYSSLVFYDEIIVAPMMNGTYTGHFDKDNLKLKTALDVFRAGFSLFQCDFSGRAPRGVFFGLPNPTQEVNSKEIIAANQLFKYGVCFILSHEFGHLTLNHLDHAPIPGEESDADYTAFFSMYENCGQDEKKSIALGCISVLGALMFSDKSLDGGPYYPDPDTRLNPVLKQIDDIHFLEADDCYGFATMLYKLWAYEQKLERIIPKVKEVQDFKEYFQIIQKSFSQYKKSLTSYAGHPTHRS